MPADRVQYCHGACSFTFSHLSSISPAESIKLKKKIKKIDRGLYRDVALNESPGEINIELSLAKPRDGYNSESISISTLIDSLSYSAPFRLL